MSYDKNSLKTIKVSILLNIIIVLMAVNASIIMYTGFKFMHGYDDIVLSSTKLDMLRFFTVQSNIFMGIIAAIFAIYEIKVLTGKINDIPILLYTFKLMSTTAVGLTFVVVFTYLGPISEGGIPVMLMNSNLFFHFIIPILSILNFIMFEKTDKLKLKYVVCGVIPTFLYSVYYMGNILLHMESGKVSVEYDWYWFVQNGVWTAIVVVPLMYGISYFISLLLWKVNRQKKRE